jgi:RNA polymerase sigma-70 factor (ECF subfamily)
VTPFHRARLRRERFADLVRAHGAVMATLARRLVGTQEAEDVVQAALASAWRHFETPEAIQNPKGWLMRFVVHECGNLVGRRMRQPPTVGLQGEEGHVAIEDIVSILQRELALSSTQDARLILDYVDQGLSRALRALSEDERTTLTLRSVAELSYKEISDAMGVPIGTVMSRLCRAREKVRVELGRRSDGPSPAEAPGRATEEAPRACPSDGETP